jgi:hypothetical protein
LEAIMQDEEFNKKLLGIENPDDITAAIQE